MTYIDFQQYCAKYGFTYTPLNISQFNKAVGQLGDIDSIYSVACDVACGFGFTESLLLAIEHYEMES